MIRAMVFFMRGIFRETRTQGLHVFGGPFGRVEAQLLLQGENV